MNLLHNKGYFVRNIQTRKTYKVNSYDDQKLETDNYVSYYFIINGVNNVINFTVTNSEDGALRIDSEENDDFELLPYDAELERELDLAEQAKKDTEANGTESTDSTSEDTGSNDGADMTGDAGGADTTSDSNQSADNQVSDSGQDGNNGEVGRENNQ